MSHLSFKIQYILLMSLVVVVGKDAFAQQMYGATADAIVECKGQMAVELRGRPGADAAAREISDLSVTSQNAADSRSKIADILDRVDRNLGEKFQFCVRQANERYSAGGQNSQRSQFIRDAERDCREAARRMQEAKGKRANFCSQITRGNRGGSADADAAGGRASSFTTCLERADQCENAISIPLGLMQGIGEGPSVVANPSCQFLMVGTCRDNRDRAERETSTIEKLEDQATRDMEDITKMQQKSTDSMQELQKQITSLNDSLENMPEVIADKLDNIDRERQKLITESQNRVREAQKEMNDLMTQIAATNANAQAEIDAANAKCQEAADKARLESEALEKQLRAQSAKNRTENLRGAQAVQNSLRQNPKRKFDECRLGPARQAELRRIATKREVAIQNLSRTMETLRGRLGDLQGNLNFALNDMETQKAATVRRAQQAAERMQRDMQTAKQQSVMKQYQDQVVYMQALQRAQTNQQRLQQSQTRKQMFDTAAKLAQNAGDTACKESTSSGRENMEKARLESVNYAASLDETISACCANFSQRMTRLGLPPMQGAQAVDDDKAGAFINREGDCSRWMREAPDVQKAFESRGVE